MNFNDPQELASLLEAWLLALGRPLSLERLGELFEEAERPEPAQIRAALEVLRQSCEGRAFELKEVASGYRLQVREKFAPWVGRLWEERPQRYSRAMLETLALIAYRQPITRGEIEDIRGVAVNSQIIKTLQERDWIRVVGYRDVPGKPAMLATTKVFLDYFNLKSRKSCRRWPRCANWSLSRYSGWTTTCRCRRGCRRGSMPSRAMRRRSSHAGKPVSAAC